MPLIDLTGLYEEPFKKIECLHMLMLDGAFGQDEIRCDYCSEIFVITKYFLDNDRFTVTLEPKENSPLS